MHSLAIDGYASQLKELAEIDGRAIGITRENHHRCLLNDAAIKGIMLCAGSESLRYAISSIGNMMRAELNAVVAAGDSPT